MQDYHKQEGNMLVYILISLLISWTGIFSHTDLGECINQFWYNQKIFSLEKDWEKTIELFLKIYLWKNLEHVCMYSWLTFLNAFHLCKNKERGIQSHICISGKSYNKLATVFTSGKKDWRNSDTRDRSHLFQPLYGENWGPNDLRSSRLNSIRAETTSQISQLEIWCISSSHILFKKTVRMCNPPLNPAGVKTC